MTRRLWPILGIVGLACASDTSQTSVIVDIVGTWSYTGVQTSPDARTLEGTLMVDTVSEDGFSGTASLTEYVPGTGNSFAKNGAMQGIAVDHTTLDFDLVIDGEGTRRHVGSLIADTITGAWAEPDAGGAALQGTFRAVRSHP
jgi:hypothetical protein